MINKNEIKRQMEWYICGDGECSRRHLQRHSMQCSRAYLHVNSMEFIDRNEWFFAKIAYTFKITIEYVRLIAMEMEDEYTKLVINYRPSRNKPNEGRTIEDEYLQMMAECSWNEVENEKKD